MKYLILLLFTVFAFSACENSSAGDDLEDRVENVADNLEDAWKKDKVAVETELKEAQAAINERIAAMEKEMENASGDAKKEIEESLAEMRTWDEQISTTLQNLGNSAENEWQALKADTKKLMDNIEDSIE